MSRLSINKIKWIKSLQDKKFRDENDVFIIEGEKLLLEALNDPSNLLQLMVTTEKAKIPKPSDSVENLICSDSEFKRISSLKHPQGCLAVLKKKEIIDIPFKNQLIMVLDGIQDPGNFGTILRTADWFGIRHVVCSTDTVDCYNPKVVQASMGAILRANILYTDLNTWISQQHLPVYGALLEGKSIYKEILNPEALILLGNEGKGIRETLKKYITHPITIPSFGLSESLNVAVASGIMLSEFKRMNT